MSIITSQPLTDIFIEQTASPRASIPYFLNFREENGSFRLDAGWKKYPISRQDYFQHIFDMDDDEPYPYRFEHFHEIRGGETFTLSDQQLGFWRDATAAQPSNRVNQLLLDALQSASDYMQNFKEKTLTARKFDTVRQAVPS